MKKYKRYTTNNKIKLDYIMLSMRLLDDILDNCSDEDVGEIVRALYSYEKSSGEVLPKIHGDGRFYTKSLINLIEEKRENLDCRSKTYRGNSMQKNCKALSGKQYDMKEVNKNG